MNIDVLNLTLNITDMEVSMPLTEEIELEEHSFVTVPNENVIEEIW